VGKLKSFRSWIPPAASLISGFIVLAIGTLTLFYLAFRKYSGEDIFFELLRDLGIALVVAGIVTLLFEVYHHLTHQMRTTREVIDAIMGEKITPEVWDEMKVLIERRTMIRRNVRIRLNLQVANGLRDHEAVLRMEHDYDVHGLTDRYVDVKIQHELDYHFRNDALDLPRFEYIEINPPGPELCKFDADQLKRRFPNGKFVSESIRLEPGHKIHVHTQRLELVHLPGSYNLYSPEFTKGLHLIFGECPIEIEPEVLVRPLGTPLDIKTGIKTATCECLLLPGQGVEIKLIRKPLVDE
jgi:hypothetical protein